MKNSVKDICAIIMAGGEGSRLRPITCTMPKPMVPLLGKPTIDYCVDLLKKHGITEIKTTLHYMGDALREHLGSGEVFGVKISHHATEGALGTAGSVRHALGDDTRTQVIISGDALTDCDLSAALEFHRAKKAPVTIVLKKVADPTEYGIALTDEENRITRFLEKPSRSEAISDLANTGIYIIEADILRRIPLETNYDFSMNLFPLLLQNDIPIYGYETTAYWCDIGDIRQYLAAQRDMLSGKVEFETTATKTGGIYTETGAQIDPAAVITPPCYIASNAQIAAGAVIGEYSVIGANSRVHGGASIKRSVLMRECIVRERAQLRGAILCPAAQADTDAGVFENSVIGERARVSNAASVTAGACVWPDKQVEPHLKVAENIIWGSSKHLVSRDDGITGYCDTQLSPETAVRLGACFGSMLNPLSGVALSTDGSRAASMLKRAFAAGAMSQGVDVSNLTYMPYPMFRFAITHMGLAGGAYIAMDSQNPHLAHITLCDETGTAFDSGRRRKLEAIFARGELTPATDRAIGVTEDITGISKAYEAYLASRIDTRDFASIPPKLLLDLPKAYFDILAPILLKQGCKVIPTDSQNGERMQSQIATEHADMGCYLDRDGNMPAIMLNDGETIQDMKLLCVLAEGIRRSGHGNSFVMPVVFPEEYARYLMNQGADIISAPEEWHRLQRSAYKAGVFHPEFFDPAAAVLKIAQMQARGELTEIVRNLPQVFTTERSLPCTRDRITGVLRSIADSERNLTPEFTDGIKLRTDRGWVIVKSNSANNACRIICGSFREEYSQDLAGVYVEKLKEALSEQRADN